MTSHEHRGITSHWLVNCLFTTFFRSTSKKTLTHWGRVTHVYDSKLTIIGSHNGLSPGRRQAIIWTNAGILLIWTFGTNFSEISSESYTFSCPTVLRPAMGTAFIMEFHNQGFVSIKHSLTVSVYLIQCKTKPLVTKWYRCTLGQQ